MSGDRDMLTEVTTLARRRVQVEQELRAAIAAAHDAGETITQLAEAAQVTRQTIYRWLAMETGETSGASIQSIRDAVSMLAGYLDAYHAGQLHSRWSTPGNGSPALVCEVECSGAGGSSGQA